MPITQTIVDVLSKNTKVLLNTVSPFAETFKVGVLGAAATLTLIYIIYQKLNRPSQNVTNLPYVGLFTFLKYAIFKDTLMEIYSKEAVMPLLKNGNNGLYWRPTVTGWFLETADPIIVKQLLLKPDNVLKKKMIDVGKDTLIERYLGGPNILFLTGDDWKRHRKIANPAFLRSMPINKFGNLTKKMFNTIEGLGNTVDAFDLFERFALDAIGVAGFDFDFNALGSKENKWVQYYDSIKGGMSHPFFIFFPMFDTKYLHYFKKRKQIHDNLSAFLKNIDDMIETKRQAAAQGTGSSKEEEEKDLLTLMIESEANEEGAKLTNEELSANLCIFFMAGHDTTANTLAFALYQMAINPEIQERARKEAIDLLGDSPEDIIPTSEQMKGMNYINMIIKETLRRNPPVYNMGGRECLEDMDLNGHFVAKGTEVAICIYNLHHNPNVWKDPYVFNPERFARGGEADNQKGFAWVPFSQGARTCIGMNFSLAEQRVALSMMLRKYKWSLPSDSPHKERLQNKGIAWALVIHDQPLDLIFEKRY